MPELPEVETMRRGVLGVVGATVVDVEKPRCRKRSIAFSPRPAAMRKRIVGGAIVAVDRIGKRVVVRIDGGDSLVLEPRMTGLVLVADPPTVDHLRFRMRLSGGLHDELLFWDRRGLGTVSLLSPAEADERLGPNRLGPDALSISVEQLRQAFRHSRREIKPALLDQKSLTGVGNLYASEILHAAGIHPQKRCDRLTRAQWLRLHDAMQRVLSEAIAYEGSTLADGTYRNALNTAGNYQNHHRVYDHAGHPCRTCGAGIVRRIVQTQRSTFFCPSCQTKR